MSAQREQELAETIQVKLQNLRAMVDIDDSIARATGTRAPADSRQAHERAGAGVGRGASAARSAGSQALLGWEDEIRAYVDTGDPGDLVTRHSASSGASGPVGQQVPQHATSASYVLKETRRRFTEYETAVNNLWIHEVEQRLPEKLVNAWRKKSEAYAWIDYDTVVAEAMFLLRRWLPSFKSGGASLHTFVYKGVHSKLTEWAKDQGPITMPKNRDNPPPTPQRYRVSIHAPRNGGGRGADE